MKRVLFLLAFMMVLMCKSTITNSSNPGDACMPDRIQFYVPDPTGRGYDGNYFHLDFKKQIMVRDKSGRRYSDFFAQGLSVYIDKRGSCTMYQSSVRTGVLIQCLPASSFLRYGRYYRGSGSPVVPVRTYLQVRSEGAWVEKSFTMGSPAMPVVREAYRNREIVMRKLYVNSSADVDDKVFEIPDDCLLVRGK